MIAGPTQQPIDLIRHQPELAPKPDLGAREPQSALFTYDVGFACETIDNGAKGPRAHFIRQPRPHRLHVDTRRERFGTMMSGEGVDCDPLEFVPFGGSSKGLFVA